MSKSWYRFLLFFLFMGPIILIGTCMQVRPKLDAEPPIIAKEITPLKNKIVESDSIFSIVKVEKDIKIKNYFSFIDSLVFHYDSLVSYELTEHLLVQANPWIIDSLVATDYYQRMEKNQFVFDQKELVILQTGDYLFVPGSRWAKQIQLRQNETKIDINIPEYTLRILEGKKERFRFIVRVGQDRERYLETAGRIENLRTRTGEGSIAKITRNPIYINPVDGHQYESTARDDDRRTMLPQIPFLHPEINGLRWGQLIHPTTNQATLGKPYSNGCIGTGEGAAWRIYYHAPIGTKVRIRYDLEVIQKNGDTLNFKDIYPSK